MADNPVDSAGLPEFRVGLAMAGAISAGAYTAGVADFLFEALGAWEEGGTKALAAAVDDPAVAAERDGYAAEPAHRVKIASLSGASAGGITSAIVAAITGGPVTPVRRVPAPADETNPFYTSWVQRIDMRHFLQTEDIERNDGKLMSALDSTRLDEITADALRIAGPHPHRPFVADPLPVYLTVANLRGVPYRIEHEGGGHGMMSHADYMEFSVTEDAARVPKSAFHLDPGNYDHTNWRILGLSALASGAFPVGLAPRRLTRKALQYKARTWLVPGLAGTETVTVDPDWDFGDDDDYEFLTVDGGLMNNEPLELARRALSGADGRNPRDAKRADRAVVMIDPFPSPPFDPDQRVDDVLGDIVKAMFGALKSQARFKPDELVLAQHRDVYSRFMISPTRTRPDAVQKETYAISSGALGGFGGFLAQSFREHDFNLGRRNCQKFLLHHFLLHRDNALFAGWPEALKTALARPQPGSEPGAPADHLPIVPLVGDALDSVPWMEWPQMADGNLADLKKQIVGRAGAALNALLRPRLGYLGAKASTAALRGYLARKAIDTIRTDLEKRGQIPPAASPKPAADLIEKDDWVD